MALKKVNWSAVQGDTFVRNVTIQERADDGSLAPLSLVGATVAAAVKKTATQVAPTVSFTAALVDAANGKFTLSLTAAQTLALAIGGYVYDVQVTFSDGTVRTYFGGSLSVTPQVTA